jgi:hypothetical protein
MKTSHALAAMAAVALLAGAAVGGPLKVRTHGTKSQNVVMCAECKAEVQCARVGDYIIGLTADLENPKLGSGRLTAHVQDSDNRPVTDASVRVTLSMPDHRHRSKTVALKHWGHGQYVTTAPRLRMSGRYDAEVAVTLAGGDTVKQVFSFTR